MNNEANPIQGMSLLDFLMNYIIKGQRPATPVERIPLPEGHLDYMAQYLTRDGSESSNTPYRVEDATIKTGKVGGMLTPIERQTLNDLILNLLKHK